MLVVLPLSLHSAQERMFHHFWWNLFLKRVGHDITIAHKNRLKIIRNYGLRLQVISTEFLACGDTQFPKNKEANKIEAMQIFLSRHKKKETYNNKRERNMLPPLVLVHEVYPQHLVARKHNNRGAQLIEAMHFDHAINELRKALRVAESLASAESASAGSSICTLDLCVASSFVDRDDQNQTGMRHEDRSDYNESKPPVGMFPRNLKEAQGEDSSCGYLFRKPVYVSAESFQDGQQMGTTLSLIAIFNLGLAYQLAALHLQQNQVHHAASSLQGTALRLYEIAYQLHIEQQKQQEEREEKNASRTADHQVGSLRFMMIIANNMSEIFRIRNDTSRHEICLENMLSVMMYVVDCEIPAVDCIEKDGLLRNASHVILRKQCAEAA